MGEVVISGDEEAQELQVSTGKENNKRNIRKHQLQETESGKTEEKSNSKQTKDKKKNRREGDDESLVRWERLFPRTVLRILLVEADDSTSQIITALLRKCSYKVATASDGLKAWEILKGRPHNIDLILTEVDLPSISGYALLTLIMEHEICKNIPVIMMSSEDSISTVYKCMLRGAVDYLVKPIRRNELRNLWQHVWRRQSSLVGGIGPHDESVGQDKVEAASENNAASNRSSGNIACMLRSKEYKEKGSDAQSSCTKPDFEVESAHKQNMHNLFQPVREKFLLDGMKMQTPEEGMNFHQRLLTHESETQASGVAACQEADVMNVDRAVEPESQRMDASINCGVFDKNDVLVNASMEAIDFMGASIDHNSSANNNIKSNFVSPHLNPSLKWSNPNGFEIQVTEGRHHLRHSNASAFTRYTDRPLQPRCPTLASVNQRVVGASVQQKVLSTVGGCKSDALVPSPRTQRSIISLATSQTKESEIATPCSQQTVMPIQIPVEGIRFNDLCNSYGSAFSPIFCKQTGASPVPSPSSANQTKPVFKIEFHPQSNLGSNSELLCYQLGQNANDFRNRTQQKVDHKLDSLEDRGHISSATDQSASSSFCNGTTSHHNNMGYGSISGSNSNVDQVAVVRAAAESKNESTLTRDPKSYRSIQREAALNKFRLKRKDRCYEKKVRYESRKKLAEQRPRVKGQFVRQAQGDPLPAEME